jgi:hypothetical protein
MEFQLVRRTGDDPLFNSLLEQHHSLRYEQPVGEHLKYLVSHVLPMPVRIPSRLE